MTIDETLSEIEAAIDSIAAWVEVKGMSDHQAGAQAWRGVSPDGWTILVASWPATSDAVPIGYGYDGTATRGGTVVRLTRELAERAAGRAR